MTRLHKFIGFWTQERLTVLMMFIAVSSLLYGVHREQINQHNQTLRQAGFELLKVSNQLQTLVHQAHYARKVKGAYLVGWSYVLFVNDMAFFLGTKVQHDAKKLIVRWRALNNDFSNSKNLNDFLIGLKKLRKATKDSLQHLS